jgi:hypothetical protein
MLRHTMVIEISFHFIEVLDEVCSGNGPFV